MDLIVCDHHIGDGIPDAIAVLDPKDGYHLTDYQGCVFKLIQGTPKSWDARFYCIQVSRFGRYFICFKHSTHC